jgi:hypothetical protein
MEFILQEVRYAVNKESVAIAVRPNSSRITTIVDLYTTQTALQARAALAGKETWADDEVLAEAQAQLESTGDSLSVEGDPIASKPAPKLELPAPSLPASI